MKTINIITIISVIFTMVMTSCSSEGDVISEMTEQNNASEVAAAISCSIYNNVTTKTSESVEGNPNTLPAEANEQVTNAVFFLMKGDQVLGYKDAVNATIYTKKQAGLSVLVIANASTDFSACTTRQEIMNKVLGSADLTSLIKKGETTITDSHYTENGSTVTAIVPVEVQQIAARIDLFKLTVNVKAADSKTVVLKSVRLLNQNTKGKLSGEYAGFEGKDVTSAVSEKAMESGNTQENISSFYTFANEESGKETAMELTFVVDGKEISPKTFKIKHTDGNNIVKSGYLYRLNITVSVYGENVEPEVTFEVADWKTSQVSGSMTEVNN